MIPSGVEGGYYDKFRHDRVDGSVIQKAYNEKKQLGNSEVHKIVCNVIFLSGLLAATVYLFQRHYDNMEKYCVTLL